MGKKIKTPEEIEIERLSNVYAAMPPKQRAVADGLIIQAARLKVRLDQLWDDIQKNGETELFTQSEKTDPYERERPAARLFTATDKNYQTIIRQLNDMIPSGDNKGSRLSAMMSDD